MCVFVCVCADPRRDVDDRLRSFNYRRTASCAFVIFPCAVGISPSLPSCRGSDTLYTRRARVSFYVFFLPFLRVVVPQTRMVSTKHTVFVGNKPYLFHRDRQRKT